LLAAGVRRVVYAVGDPDPRVNGRGAKLLREAGVQVDSGLLEAEAEEMNEGFMTRLRRKRPFIRLKSGASLDGRVALANGESRWITGAAAREDVQRWRAQSAAVLTSAATVLADNPRLDVRIETPRQPLRVVLDRRRQVKKGARILKAPGRALIFAAASAARVKSKPLAAPEMLGDATIERVRVKNSHLDLVRVFARLAELQINEVLVEAGPRLAGALLRAGLVDEWLVYVAPKLLGRDARPLAALPRLTRLASAPEFDLRESTAVGGDVRLRLRPKGKR
jgi:diaminohydroxyphosphoribosylaminopyrimidine deaminase/5-amino-6-(5-phosphoribosylamino)uracil reductase